jgi:hypothetical protein
MLGTGYHKGYIASGKLKVIHRFLPEEVGTLLVYYLWLVIPSWEDMLAFSGLATTFQPNIWPGRDGISGPIGLLKPAIPYWNSIRVTRALRTAFMQACGQRIGISEWRHMSKAINRRFLRSVENAFNSIGLGLNSGSEDSDSSTEPSSGSEDEASPQVGRIHQASKKTSKAYNSLWDQQAGHTTFTANQVYGRLISRAGLIPEADILSFRTISVEWHKLLAMPSVISPNLSTRGSGKEASTASTSSKEVSSRKRRATSTFEAQQYGLRVQRLQALQEVDIDLELRKLYSNTATFRSFQRPAISAIIGGVNPLLIVMGTNSRKSLCFMLPAAASNTSCTVVIVPLLALLDDLQARCQELRIASHIWTSESPYESSSIVFTTPEAAQTALFQAFLNQQIYSGRLDRIFIDEAHQVIEGNKDFRPKLAELGRLGLRGVQIVYLTATLPPHKEAAFLDVIQYRQADITILRSSTSRPNIRYTTLLFPISSGQDLVATAITSVKELVGRRVAAGLQGLIIIYCPTKAMVNRVADVLGCYRYYSDVDTANSKADTLKAWRAASSTGAIVDNY